MVDFKEANIYTISFNQKNRRKRNAYSSSSRRQQLM